MQNILYKQKKRLSSIAIFFVNSVAKHAKNKYIIGPKKSGKKNLFFFHCGLHQYVWICMMYAVRMSICTVDWMKSRKKREKKNVKYFDVNVMWLSNGRRVNWMVCRCCCFYSYNLTRNTDNCTPKFHNPGHLFRFVSHISWRSARWFNQRTIVSHTHTLHWSMVERNERVDSCLLRWRCCR